MRRKNKKHFLDYLNLKIILLVLTTGAFYLWIRPFSTPAHSEENLYPYKIENKFIAKDKNIFASYSAKTELSYCEEDRVTKRNSLRCKKDIEPEIAQIEIIREIAPKPKVEAAENTFQLKPVKIAPTRNIPKSPIHKAIAIKKRTCAHKNDHPSKSKTKGHHMDEDCCLDPDESKNPACAY
jgi:hypothetical protein